MSQSLVIGSRGSKLALFQSEQAKARLEALNPDLQVRIEIIRTTGDVKTEPLTVIGGKGVFTKELEDALLDRRIDLAVHSLKDLPTILPDGLTIGAICEREDPRDALVLPGNVASSNASLRNLTDGAVVGTSSQRRVAQLKALRPDVEIKDVRGNVDTRIRKLDEGQYDALILASAGLRRLGLAERITAAIATDEMLPAVGQGAVAIEARNDSKFALESIAKLNHNTTRIACLAERALLRSLGGGCQLPIAAHAVVNGDELLLEGLVASQDGTRILRDFLKGPSKKAEELGANLAERLISLGANALLSNTFGREKPSD
jgi:hydroxymethylbilane synthase